MNGTNVIMHSEVKWGVMCRANNRQRARTIQSVLWANEIPTLIGEQAAGIADRVLHRAVEMFPIEVPLGQLQQAKEILRRFGQLV